MRMCALENSYKARTELAPAVECVASDDGKVLHENVGVLRLLWSAWHYGVQGVEGKHAVVCCLGFGIRLERRTAD
jgi:hypothetical protein